MSARGIAALFLAAITVSISGCLETQATRAQVVLNDPWEAYLLNSPYDQLRIVARFAPGAPPSKLGLDGLVVRASEMTLKRAIHLDELTPLTGWAAEERAWTVADLYRMVRSESIIPRGQYGEGTTAIFEVFYLDGNGPDSAGGMELDGRAFIFDGGRTDAVPIAREQFERRTVIHEFGHAIGLVNCGLPMLTPREDPGSPCHSTGDSVMAPPTLTVTPGGADPDAWTRWTFDEFDMADVRDFQAQHGMS